MDFYKSNRSMCKDCVRERTNNRKKEVKRTTLNILEELLENQRVILSNQERMVERISDIESSIEGMVSDIEKITRRLKWLST